MQFMSDFVDVIMISRAVFSNVVMLFMDVGIFHCCGVYTLTDPFTPETFMS